MTEHVVYTAEHSVPVTALLRSKLPRDDRSLARNTAIPLRLNRAGNWPTHAVRWASEDPDWQFHTARNAGVTKAAQVVAPTQSTSRLRFADDRRLHLDATTPAHPAAAPGLLGVDADAENPRPVRQSGLSGRPMDRIAASDLYTGHFGIAARPFALLPDPDFLFWSAGHRRTYAMLEYGLLSRAPITLISGEIGAGKTTLVHQLLKQMGDEVRVGLISNTQGTADEMLRWVLMSLGLKTEPDATYADLILTCRSFLIEQYAAGNRVVLIFDEAQNLGADALEELRMLTNINSFKDELLQIVLVGQPELRDLMRRPEMHRFAQRISASWHLSAMDIATTRSYIAHRLQVSGATREIFSASAIDLIHQAVGGIPRRINQLCEQALVAAYVDGQRSVTSACVQRVLDQGSLVGMALDAPLMIAAE